MLKTQQRRNIYFDYTFVFISIIYAGNATTFVRSVETWENLLGFIIPIFFSILLAYKYNVRISKGFAYLLIGFIVYNVILTYKYNEIHPRFMGIYLSYFIIAYITISSLHHRFFIYYESILYYLCIIALFFWGIQLIIPETLMHIFKIISFSQPGSGNVASNILIYTIPEVSGFESYQMDLGWVSVIRNAGFAWEPGAFACHINLAIFINLFRTNFSLRNNLKFWIFLIALLTTFSTTGFTLFILLMLFYMYNQNKKSFILFVPIAFAAIIYLSSLQFMTEKIKDTTNYDTEEMIDNSITYDQEFTPQRIQSYEIDFIDFMNNPIFGYGGNDKDKWTTKLGADISTISGIGKVMSIFGIVGILFFFINLTNTSMEFAKDFHFKGWGFPFLMIIMISISYSIIFGPVLMCFWLMNSNYIINNS